MLTKSEVRFFLIRFNVSFNNHIFIYLFGFNVAFIGHKRAVYW